MREKGKKEFVHPMGFSVRSDIKVHTANWLHSMHSMGANPIYLAYSSTRQHLTYRTQY